MNINQPVGAVILNCLQNSYLNTLFRFFIYLQKNQILETEKRDSALRVNSGVEQPSQVNNESVARYKRSKKPVHSVDEFIDGILKGDRTLFSQAITMVESKLARHQELAQMIIEKCLPFSGNSVRVGITGVPGVGKSTFIEALGMYLTGKGRKVAVLAIDPSSERTRGSILGDKTRMETLAINENAFIRPSPSAGSLGGVARKTHESIIICEAAGYDTIFVETVGVGQSETAVHSMVDFFLLLMLAGAGDELQGIKRGIMEMADAIIINKADGDNYDKAMLAKREYANALHLFPPQESGWVPKTDVCSAQYNTGIDKVWKIVTEDIELTRSNGYFHANRQQQAVKIMMETINRQLLDRFYLDEKIEGKIESYKKDILADRISSYQAAQEMLDYYLRNRI